MPLSTSWQNKKHSKRKKETQGDKDMTEQEEYKPEYLFHGGCCGCSHQLLEGVEFCVRCQYFDADWSLPDFNNRPLNKMEKKRAELKAQKPRR